MSTKIGIPPSTFQRTFLRRGRRVEYAGEIFLRFGVRGYQNGRNMPQGRSGRQGRATHRPAGGVRDALSNLVRKRDNPSFGESYVGEWRRGTSPLRSLRTRREPLDSPGSHHPAVGRAPNCQCGNSEGCLLAMLPSQNTAFVRWSRNFLNFLIAHLTSMSFR